MKGEDEEALVAFLILIGTGVLIYFNAVVLDLFNAVWEFVCFFVVTLQQQHQRHQEERARRRRQTRQHQEEQTRRRRQTRRHQVDPTRRRSQLDELMEQERKRTKRDAPDMPTECPCCLERLFDSNGVAVDNKDIAKGLPCHVHLIHDECLTLAGQSLNADGQRYGNSVFGPRSGCPICGQGVSFWFTTKKATDFGIFWWHKIQKCIEQVGRDNGPVSVDVVMDMLRNDSSLTRKQKSLIFRIRQGQVCL